MNNEIKNSIEFFLKGKEVLEEFLESIRSTEKLMMNADEKMTESMKQRGLVAMDICEFDEKLFGL